jgi:hypothetical protein
VSGLIRAAVLVLLVALGCDEPAPVPLSSADGAPGDAARVPDSGDPPADAGLTDPLGRCPGELPGLALGVWVGQHVWFAGGGPGLGGGVLARLDEGAFRRVPTPPGPALWWVWGPAGGDAEIAVGDGGRILEAREGGWSHADSGLPPEAVLWGVWGASREDVWAVGGSPRPGGP